MIKFLGSSGTTQVIGFGLSRANCEKLLAGHPIRIPLDELHPSLDFDVVIFGGETEGTDLLGSPATSSP